MKFIHGDKCIYGMSNPELQEKVIELLKAKFMYYQGVYHGFRPTLSDEQYDNLETEYKRICEKEGITPWVSNMVGYSNNYLYSHIIEGWALRESNPERYDALHKSLFKTKDDP